jgi:NTE family protein
MHGTRQTELPIENQAGSTLAPVGRDNRKVINLALQGGGSHGAFTWGVLDRLLEEEDIFIEGITATSAGAVNAVALAYGLGAGGRKVARSALKNLWERTSVQLSHGPFQASLIDKMSASFGLEHSPGYVLMDALSYFSSPYQYNPFNYNPLKSVLEEVIDFEILRAQRRVKLFLCATNACTGKLKVFNGVEITPDHVLAASCLPLLMHAVEIDGEYYWDGGFAGNPAIFPVIYECDARDIVVIHLTPLERPQVPTGSRAIMHRMQEISFNSSLIREMRAVAFITKLIDSGKWADGKRVLMHAIEAQDVTRELPDSSRLNSDWDFLSHLFEIGRQRADIWLEANFDHLGRESTIDLEAKYF